MRKAFRFVLSPKGHPKELYALCLILLFALPCLLLTSCAERYESENVFDEIIVANPSAFESASGMHRIGSWRDSDPGVETNPASGDSKTRGERRWMIYQGLDGFGTPKDVTLRIKWESYYFLAEGCCRVTSAACYDPKTSIRTLVLFRTTAEYSPGYDESDFDGSSLNSILSTKEFSEISADELSELVGEDLSERMADDGYDAAEYFVDLFLSLDSVSSQFSSDDWGSFDVVSVTKSARYA